MSSWLSKRPATKLVTFPSVTLKAAGTFKYTHLVTIEMCVCSVFLWMRVVKLYWSVIICFPILSDRHMCCSSVKNKTERFVVKTAVNSIALVDCHLIKHFIFKKLASCLLICIYSVEIIITTYWLQSIIRKNCFSFCNHFLQYKLKKGGGGV